MHRATVADKHPDFVPLRHPAKVGQSPLPQFARRLCGPLSLPNEGVLHKLRGFLVQG
jgi:hypothetical protein